MPSAACTLQPSARSASIHSSRMVIASAPRRTAPTRAAASRHSPCTRSLSCASAPHTCSPLAAPASGYGADGGRCDGGRRRPGFPAVVLWLTLGPSDPGLEGARDLADKLWRHQVHGTRLSHRL